ncbi:MAG: hypothetical protein KAV82_01320 [Phycisphaerae bacterium]|nr:hypothetical protein [Phycisphaerae bacterium]
MKPAVLFIAVLLALPLAFVLIRVLDPVVPYDWRTIWRFLAVVGIPALVCGLAYMWTVGRPQPPPQRCSHCGALAYDPCEPNCLECGKPLEPTEP